jgi:hypothetical protein
VQPLDPCWALRCIAKKIHRSNPLHGVQTVMSMTCGGAFAVYSWQIYTFTQQKHVHLCTFTLMYTNYTIPRGLQSYKIPELQIFELQNSGFTNFRVTKFPGNII